MFDLEQSINTWRQQMQAGGLLPAQVSELENHLREEIAQLVTNGLAEADAFPVAVQKIGPAPALRQEFRKSTGWLKWLEFKDHPGLDRILAAFWLVYCIGSFTKYTPVLWHVSRLPGFDPAPFFFLAVAMDYLYLRGAVACVLMFFGIRIERRVIFFLAIMDALGGVCVLWFKSFHLLSFAFTILGFITIWLLWPWQKEKTVAE